MSCCASNSTGGTNACFSKWSKRYAKRFRKNGLEKAQRLLLEGIRKEPVREKNILDIGCGVGSLHITLLQEGAARATGVDVAEGMLQKAKELSSEFGLHEKVSYKHGDFVELADSIPDADITILDKVVCCYGDLDRLLEKSVNKTTRIYGLVHPKNNFLVGGMFKLQIAVLKLFRSKFRPFWHDWDLMHQKITQRGFRLLYEKPTFAWNVAVFQRI
jgi:magnesium-protoporphyrin O-methyltransferase